MGGVIRMSKDLTQYGGFFIAEGYRKRFFVSTAESWTEAQTEFFTMVDEYAKEMDCKQYTVEVTIGDLIIHSEWD